jgi:hypothetical protein
MLILKSSIFLLFGLLHGTSADADRVISPHSALLVKRLSNSTSTGLFSNSTNPEIDKARAIVEKARKEWSAYKRARLANPRRNVYKLRPTEPVQARVLATDNSTATEPFLPPEVTDEIAHAAALLAELEVAEGRSNKTAPVKQKRATRFWMENIDHLGTQPYGGNSSYQVRRRQHICHTSFR